ncbi:hypothetical protein BJ875DRAFT_468708 [Amylocarpus encephaloides]|uniref:Uncharacterized protein n=1 Tax=Amylocarpus encephaloides TaxID=45428 RepID=A0A9P8C475_9HELO|nr:hypothetical protein BJ875DRAFT_468708 [Amylocarpus encephaloides]
MSSSQSSIEETPTPIEAPSTPVLHRSDSPAYGTTSLISLSITPPPSSQHHVQRPAAMTAARLSHTPDIPPLSSPPPTVANASTDDLRGMAESLLAENAKLDIAAREARMSAAHYKLQHNLLTIESEEAVKHLEVEHDMTLREVELLQMRVQDAQDPPELEHYRRRSRLLEEENRKLSDSLRKAKRVIISNEDDITNLELDVKQLRERIRVNRSHINEMRSPGGIYHNPSLHNSPATPQHYRSTPKHTPMTSRSVRQARDHSQEPFAALLLADRVLSQENSSAPSTPIVQRRPIHRTPNRHNRNVQSLSSLPTTPGSARTSAVNSTLLPSAQFSSQAEARVTSTLGSGTTPQPRERRRKSRDSTISASDAEEIARSARSYREESAEVPESQASQSAIEMLRRDPRESFDVAASRATTPNPINDKTNLSQAKIFGVVTKPTVEKRKRGDDEPTSYDAKKLRAMASVGLGIGFDATRA